MVIKVRTFPSGVTSSFRFMCEKLEKGWSRTEVGRMESLNLGTALKIRCSSSPGFLNLVFYGGKSGCLQELCKRIRIGKTQELPDLAETLLILPFPFGTEQEY